MTSRTTERTTSVVKPYTNLYDIYVSYHDTDTQHRHRSDFLAAVQATYGNTTYNAWHIIATSN